jgi:tetratricopeptide (TPR) repeat protein
MAKLRRKPAPQAKPARPKAKPPAKPAKAAARPGTKAKPAPKTAHKAKPAVKTRPGVKVAARPQAKAPAKPVAAKPGAKPAAKKVVAAPAPPPRRSTYIDAVAMYERGVQALQARKYREAAETLRGVIAQYPEEKELHERAVLYLRVCERQLAAAPKAVESLDDRVYAATVALNNAQVDQAISLLLAVVSTDAEHDHAIYMLGVAYALKGDYARAVQHLSRAMALNPENRDLARKEPDLEALRHTEDMRQLLASPPAPIARRTPRAPRPRR